MKMIANILYFICKALGGGPAAAPGPEPVLIAKNISRTAFVTAFRAVGIEPIIMLDSILLIADKTELDRIAPYLVFPADEYVAEENDCEDYALRGQVDAGRDFKVSGIRMVLGNTPAGYHAFLATLDTDGEIWWMEPNAGFDFAGVWHKICEQGYEPDKVLV